MHPHNLLFFLLVGIQFLFGLDMAYKLFSPSFQWHCYVKYWLHDVMFLFNSLISLQKFLYMVYCLFW